MKIPKLLVALMICLAGYQNLSAQATFTTAADTVTGNAYQCSSYYYYYGYYSVFNNPITAVPAIYPVDIQWEVVASNFPPDWVAAMSFADTDMTWQNLYYNFWNGTMATPEYDYYGFTYSPFYLLLTQNSLTSYGTYWVEVNISAGGYNKNIWYVVTRNNILSADSISGSPAICIGDPVNLTDPLPGGEWGDVTGRVYVNYISGQATGESPGNDTIIYHTYYELYTGGDSCSIEVEITKPVTIGTPVKPVIAAFGGMLYTTAPFLTYQWETSGAIILGATNATYDPFANGAYAVIVTDSNGCTDTSVMVYDNNVSVPQVSAAGNSIKVYPNPASSVVYIDAGAPVNARLTTLDGEVISESSNTAQIDLSNVANGTYLLTIYDNSGANLKTEKIVKVGH